MSQNPLLAPIYPLDQHPEFTRMDPADQNNMHAVSILADTLSTL